MRLLGRASIALVACTGLALSLAFWWTVRASTAAQVQERLAGQTETAVVRLETELERHVDALRAGRGLFLASDAVTPAAWAAFAASLRLDERLPSANGIAFVASVPATELEEFIARQRAAGLPDYDVAPRLTDDTDRLRPIAYIEPRERNAAALGFNLLANPVLTPAASPARDTGETRMTAPTRLVQETGEQTGFVVYTPLYATATPPPTVDERRSSLRGWIATPFRGDDFLEAVFDEAGLDLAVTVEDLSPVADGPRVIGTWRADDPSDRLDAVTRRIEVLGRTWQVAARPTPALVAADPAAWLALLAGLVVTALVVVQLRAHRDRERRAQRLADDATAQLVASQEGLAAANELLARRNRQLDHSNQELARFAYVASHDLQEPLRMVTSFLGLLEEHLEGQLDDEGRQYIGFATDGASRMAALIRDLLALSRVEHGERSPTTVDVAALLDETLLVLGDRIAEADAEIEVEQADAVEGDARQLGQLVQNLLGNALKFRRTDRPARIAVAARRSACGWRLEVRDNGVGVPDEFREQVFGAFRRLHGRDRYDGTGIGLAICARIVEGHGGSIVVEEGIDGGAAFVVWLPQASPECGEHGAGGHAAGSGETDGVGVPALLG